MEEQQRGEHVESMLDPLLLLDKLKFWDPQFCGRPPGAPIAKDTQGYYKLFHDPGTHKGKLLQMTDILKEKKESTCTNR